MKKKAPIRREMIEEYCVISGKAPTSLCRTARVDCIYQRLKNSPNKEFQFSYKDFLTPPQKNAPLTE